MTEADYWRKCSTCKSPIPHQHVYWVCNVSTCSQRSTAFVFCSVDCWDAHVPTMRHKDAWAEERQSPAAGADGGARNERSAPRKKRVEMRAKTRERPQESETAGGQKVSFEPRPPDEILVVASKIKAYIRARSGLNTSAGLMDALSEKVRRICDQAIRTAVQNERKTVMDRDGP